MAKDSSRGYKPHIPLDLAEALLDAGYDVNMPSGSAVHPLHLAVAAQNEDIVRLFLERGADVNFSVEKGYTPLAVAIRSSSMSLIQLLTEHGADWHFRTAAGSNALHLACDVGVAKLALQAGVSLEDVKTIPPNSRARLLWHTPRITPLMRACERGLVDLAMFLLEQGALTDVLNKGGFNMLYAVACRGKVDLVKLLHARGLDVNAKNWNNGRTPLHHPVAVMTGDIVMAKTLLLLGADVEVRDSIGCTPIHLAHSEESIRLLVEHGADINSQCTLSGSTALHSLVSRDFRDSTDEIQLFIELGASLTVLNDHGDTPLYSAINRGTASAVRVLLTAGADMNVPDRDGYPPLLLACYKVECWSQECVEKVRVLLDAGANVNVEMPKRWCSCDDRQITTAMRIASSLGHKGYSNRVEPDVKVALVRMLLEAGADVRCGERFFNDQMREDLKGTLYKLGISLSGYTITEEENSELVVRPVPADVRLDQ